METVANEVRNSETVDERADDPAADLADDQADDHADDQVNNQVDHQHDQVDGCVNDQAEDQVDEQAGDTVIKLCSKQQTTSSDDAFSMNSTNAITQQPKSTSLSTEPNRDPKDTQQNLIPSAHVHEKDVDVEVLSSLDHVDVELAMAPGTCLSASAGVGSASKDLCGGFTNLECRYPNVGCELSCGCDDGLQLVTECTMELCSANCILGCLAFSLGIALDTKAVWNRDGVEFEVLGTGIETSQGKVLRVLGSGIGIIDDEKREAMQKKRKVKEERRAQQKASKEKEKIVEKPTELEISGQDNTAIEIEEETVASP